VCRDVLRPRNVPTVGDVLGLGRRISSGRPSEKPSPYRHKVEWRGLKQFGTDFQRVRKKRKRIRYFHGVKGDKVHAIRARTGEEPALRLQESVSRLLDSFASFVVPLLPGGNRFGNRRTRSTQRNEICTISLRLTARRVSAKLKKPLDRGFLFWKLHCTSFFVSFVTFCLKSDREATDAISPSGPDGR
jgi:hypothetical protein